MASALALAVLLQAHSGTPAVQNRSFLADTDLLLHHTRNNACGVAAVYLTLLRYGREISLDDAFNAVPHGRHGTSMAQFVAELERAGLHADAVEISAASLGRLLQRDRSLSAISLVRGNHWVVVSGSAGGSLACFDYPNWRTDAECNFKSHYSGKSIVVRDGGSTTIRSFSVENRVLTGIAAGVFFSVFGLLLNSFGLFGSN